MFVRIVKMSFELSKIDTFTTIFDGVNQKIRNTKGCCLLELYQDKSNPSIFFTYSYWKTEHDLENYRNSQLFKTVWAETKVLFNAKPEAWSLDKKVSLN